MMVPLYILFLIFSLVVCKEETPFEFFSSKNELFDVEKAEAAIVSFIDSAEKQILPQAYRVLTKTNTSIPCTMGLFRFLTDLKKLKVWAWKMLDAIGKPPAGIFEGTMLMLGDYDECLAINLRNVKGKRLFQGKYCTVTLRMFDDTPDQLKEIKKSPFISALIKIIPESLIGRKEADVYIGLCIPSTCTAQEVNQVIRFVAKNLIVGSQVSCETKTKKVLYTGQIVVLSTLGVIGFLVIVGTCIDVLQQFKALKYKSCQLSKLLLGFSFYSNTVCLFRTIQHDTKLSALRGFRVLTAFWIVLGHVYFQISEVHYSKFRGMSKLKEWVETTVSFKTLTCATLSVDSFFLISGMLFLYSNWNRLEMGKGAFKILLYTILKIIRILPVEMLVIGIYLTLPLFSDGPFTGFIYGKDYNNCKNYWWRNLLFIQNFWPSEEICLPPTWYIGALFQLFLLTFWVILLLYRWPKLGIFMNVVLGLIGCLLTGFLTSYYNFPSVLSPLTGFKKLRKFMTIVYISPPTYFPSFCIGILLGYIMVKKRSPKIKLWIQVASWLAAICGSLLALYSSYYFDSESNTWINIIYAALYRPLWSSSVAWMLFACFTGYGGIIGQLLSWKVLVFLDKLTLMIYLVHPLIISFNGGVTRSLMNMGHIEQSYIFLATLTITVFFSYILNVTVEQPLNHIQSNIYSKLSSNQTKDVEQRERSVPSVSSLVSDTNVVVLSSKTMPENKL